MYVGHQVVTNGLLRVYMGLRDKLQTRFEENDVIYVPNDVIILFSLHGTSLNEIFYILY